MRVAEAEIRGEGTWPHSGSRLRSRSMPAAAALRRSLLVEADLHRPGQTTLSTGATCDHLDQETLSDGEDISG
jgi:hypothetical protein